MTVEALRIAGAGGRVLDARLELPLRTPLAYAVYAHCFACGKDQLGAARVAAGLARHGLAVLRFDMGGLDDATVATFSANVADVVHAVRHVAAARAAPALLVGHSLGGAAVLAAARELDSVRAIATIGAPAEPAHVLRTLAKHAREPIDADGDVTLGGRRFDVDADFVADVERFDLRPHIAGLRRALLVMHAPDDDIVPVDHARRIFEAARHPKSFIALDGVDHLVTRATDAKHVADLIAVWATHYL